MQMLNTYERKQVPRSILNGMGEFVVIKTDMAQVDLEKIKLDQEVRAQFIPFCLSEDRIDILEQVASPVDKILSDAEMLEEIEEQLLRF